MTFQKYYSFLETDASFSPMVEFASIGNLINVRKDIFSSSILTLKNYLHKYNEDCQKKSETYENPC